MMEAFEAWELRWIARRLPTRGWWPSSSFDPTFTVVHEHDIYVLTPSDRPGLGLELDIDVIAAHPYIKNTFPSLWDETWTTDFTRTSLYSG